MEIVVFFVNVICLMFVGCYIDVFVMVWLNWVVIDFVVNVFMFELSLVWEVVFGVLLFLFV